MAVGGCLLDGEWGATKNAGKSGCKITLLDQYFWPGNWRKSGGSLWLGFPRSTRKKTERGPWSRTGRL